MAAPEDEGPDEGGPEAVEATGVAVWRSCAEIEADGARGVLPVLGWLRPEGVSLLSSSSISASFQLAATEAMQQS